jgi:hypothetical protein
MVAAIHTARSAAAILNEPLAALTARPEWRGRVFDHRIFEVGRQRGFLMARVLLVEYEEQVRVLAESYLREQGHSTLCAATSVEALAALDARILRGPLIL